MSSGARLDLVGRAPEDEPAKRSNRTQRCVHDARVQRRRAARGSTGQDALGRQFQLFRRRSFVDQAEPTRRLSAQQLARQQQRQRGQQPNGSRQSLRSAETGKDSEQHFRQSEFGV